MSVPVSKGFCGKEPKEMCQCLRGNYVQELAKQGTPHDFLSANSEPRKKTTGVIYSV